MGPLVSHVVDSQTPSGVKSTLRCTVKVLFGSMSWTLTSTSTSNVGLSLAVGETSTWPVPWPLIAVRLLWRPGSAWATGPKANTTRDNNRTKRYQVIRSIFMVGPLSYGLSRTPLTTLIDGAAFTTIYPLSLLCQG